MSEKNFKTIELECLGRSQKGCKVCQQVSLEVSVERIDNGSLLPVYWGGKVLCELLVCRFSVPSEKVLEVGEHARQLGAGFRIPNS